MYPFSNCYCYFVDPMESSGTSSRFRFRDHNEDADNSSDSGSTISDISSISSLKDDEDLDLESMTGKGIKRLCNELLEIKTLSDEDFHRNIFWSYSAFVGIFDEVKDLENEINQLKSQVAVQKKLVKDLTEGVYLKFLSKEAMESIIGDLDKDDEEENIRVIELEKHVNDVSEIIDMLLMENRVDEAISILETEENKFQTLVDEGDIPSGLLAVYNSTFSDRKAMLILQLTLAAENSRISAAELQKELAGLCRLGDGHLAMQLLLKYYRSRVASGMNDLQDLGSFLHVAYIKKLSKFVFSVISQAATCFVKLHGETSPYASELFQWIREEIDAFSSCFIKYVNAVSDISGGLSAAVEAAQIAVSYCSLLEGQKLVLRPLLIKHIRPCMEGILQIHIDHFKKVIGIFTATDAWVLGRYPGVSSESNSDDSGYCLLTSSGRKFITLLQAVAEDVTPLVALKMEGCILKGLMDLFMEYISILEKAITSESNTSEKGDSILLAESLLQQVSILSNLSTLEHFLSSTIISIFNGSNFEQGKNHSVGFRQEELDSCLLCVQEASGLLRAHFCQQFIDRVVPLERAPEICISRYHNRGSFEDALPSVAFQVLFLELRKLDKLAQEYIFQEDWTAELMSELIQAIFVWISNNKEIWESNEDNLIFQHPQVLNQFILDMHFLDEITRYGEHLSTRLLIPANLAESVLISAGVDPIRFVEDGEWTRKVTIKATEMLLEIEKRESASNDEIAANIGKESLDSQYSETIQDEIGSFSGEFLASAEDVADVDASRNAVNLEKFSLNVDQISSVDKEAVHLKFSSKDVEVIESENAAYDKFHFTEETTIPQQLPLYQHLTIEENETVLS